MKCKGSYASLKLLHASSFSLCDGGDHQTEFHRSDTYPGAGMACGAEWQRHGRHCTDWLWQDPFRKWNDFCLDIFSFLHARHVVLNRRVCVLWPVYPLSCVLKLFSLQYLLPAIVHINHQPFLERGDGPIVSCNRIFVSISLCGSYLKSFFKEVLT